MQFSVIFRILGILLMVFSSTHLVPLAVSLFYDDGQHLPFVSSFLATFVAGLILWVPFYKANADLRTRDGFLITSCFWILLGLFGALPFLFNDQHPLSLSDAIFESVSGLTTTGASVFSGIDQLPPSVNYYRHQLHFLGGIGVVLIAVAILPMLGIGGMQIYKAEAPGPVKDSKLTPRITQTASWLFFIYSTIGVACALAFWLAGMTLFDAICYSFSIISLGGFAPHDASMGFYQDPLIWVIGAFFMFVSGLNFALHYPLWHSGNFRQYFSDSESRFFFFYMLLASLFVTLSLILYGVHNQLENIHIHAVFQLISIATTTGLLTADLSSWPAYLPMLILLTSCIGGCAGSSGGGLKVIRVILIAKQGLRELKQLVHPNAVIPIKLKKKTVPNDILAAVWSFLAVYMLVFLLIVISLQASGLDFMTAYSATLASLNNMGVGLGAVASNFAGPSDMAKWILCASMILGRLEIFTLLVLFSPAFWQR